MRKKDWVDELVNSKSFIAEADKCELEFKKDPSKFPSLSDKWKALIK